MPSKVQLTLAKAARILRRHGHTKHRLKKDQTDGSGIPGPVGAYCVMGAINQARTQSEHYPMDASNDEAQVLLDHLGISAMDRDTYPAVGSAVDWNNAIERTPCEVILACEAAAGPEAVAAMAEEEV